MLVTIISGSFEYVNKLVSILDEIELFRSRNRLRVFWKSAECVMSCFIKMSSPKETKPVRHTSRLFL